MSFLLAEAAPSRASSLPQGNALQMWERACSRRGQCSQRKSPFKLRRLKDTFRHAFQATNSCAIAYSYARIRRLVRLGSGFYCGAVADESAIGFSDLNLCRRTSAPNSTVDAYLQFALWRLCAGDLRVCRAPTPGSLTCVQPPPYLFSDGF